MVRSFEVVLGLLHAIALGCFARHVLAGLLRFGQRSPFLAGRARSGVVRRCRGRLRRLPQSGMRRRRRRRWGRLSRRLRLRGGCCLCDDRSRRRCQQQCTDRASGLNLHHLGPFGCTGDGSRRPANAVPARGWMSISTPRDLVRDGFVGRMGHEQGPWPRERRVQLRAERSLTPSRASGPSIHRKSPNASERRLNYTWLPLMQQESRG